MEEIKDRYLVVNGNYLPADESVLRHDNRAFQYADGLFETIRIVNGLPWNFNAHFDRLLAGMRALKLESPAFFKADRLIFHIQQLCEKNGLDKGGRAKLVVFRNPGGKYLPSDNGVSYLLTVESVENNLFVLNEPGLSLETYTDLKKQVNFLSNFKTLHAGLYVLAALSVKERGFSEAIILNERGAMIETVSSNLFLVFPGQVILTPGLEEGCLAGTMRMHVINLALAMGYKVYESTIQHSKMMQAEEVFTTNAVKGVQWVGRYQSKRYYHKCSDRLVEKLNEYVLSSMTDPPENSPE